MADAVLKANLRRLRPSFLLTQDRVRVCIGSPDTREELQHALAIVARTVVPTVV